MAKPPHSPALTFAFAAICFLLINLPLNSAGQSSAVLDFQTLEHSGTGFSNAGNIYKEKGFVLTGNANFHLLAVWNTGASQYTGSTALFNNSEDDIPLSRDDGGQFDFLGIDLAPLDKTEGRSGPITFRGYRDGQLVATQVFQLNGSGGVQHFTPSTAFGNLTEVRWPQNAVTHQFDNVAVRSIGGSLPVHMTINPPGSSIVLDLSHMHVGTHYILQTSTDLVGWSYVNDFTAYSSTFAYFTQVPLGQELAFFRLLVTP
jgi:hypothetical protein